MTTLEALNNLMDDKFLTERRIVDFISKEIEGFENRNGNIVAGQDLRFRKESLLIM